jgi:hypothetical protein
MFWKFLIMVVLGLFFIKFGMMVAVVPLLAGGLQIAVAVILLMVAFAIFKVFKKRT